MCTSVINPLFTFWVCLSQRLRSSSLTLKFELRPNNEISKEVKPFLPRDAMHKRGLWRHTLSAMCVCPSVTFVSCVKGISSKFFHHRPSQGILVFPCQTGWRYSDGNPPPNGGIECRWGRQKPRFWMNIWLRVVRPILDHLRVVSQVVFFSA